MKQSDIKENLILVLSVFMLSTAPVLVKFLSIKPIIILFWRLFFVSLILLPFAYKDLRNITKQDFKNIGFSAVILFLHFLSWFSGVQKLDVGVTVVTFASNPIFTAFIAFIVLRETFRKRYLLAIISSIMGIYVAYFSGKEHESTLSGVLLVLCAAFLYSTYMVYSKKNRANLKNSVYTFYLNLITCSLGFISIVAMSFMGQISVQDIFPMENLVWLKLLSLAFFPSVLGHTLMIYSLPKYNLNFISCLKLLSPLSASLMAIYFFNETINKELVIGFILVSTGVLFALPWKKLSFLKLK